MKTNNMKTLPKYFAIKLDKSNPLWKKYIDWLNETYNAEWWHDVIYKFIGFSGFEANGGTETRDSLHDFKNVPELITLEFWDECVNGEKRKVLWYNPPYELFRGIIKTNDRYVKCGIAYTCLRLSRYALPPEFVEKEFIPIYEEEKLEVLNWYNYEVTNQSKIIFEGKLTQEKVDKIKEVINE